MENKTKNILIIGNPNVGKSTIFNALSGKQQKTGNYAGVTVSALSGEYIYKEEKVKITDVPGAYSLYPQSQDEEVFTKKIIENQNDFQGIVYVMEAVGLKRGLLLFQQVQDLGFPMLLVINQIDVAQSKGVKINTSLLSEKLGVKIIETSGKKSLGIEDLKEAIYQGNFTKSTQTTFSLPKENKMGVEVLETEKDSFLNYQNWVNEISFQNKSSLSKRAQVQETVRRYENIDKILNGVVQTSERGKKKNHFTKKVDKILVHPVLGYLIFAILMLLVFESVFFFAEFPMAWIEGIFASLSEKMGNAMKDGPLKSLFVDGIIPGVAGVVVFAPQIGTLLFLLYLLEDSGYMARIVFLTDRFLRPLGLSGKSVIPFVSATACAVPAIMGARNIENKKEKLITILVTPFMSCSARLPIYTIIIALIIPQGSFLGISYQALTMFSMYLLGTLMALFSAYILKKIIKSEEKSFLIMDLPTYKIPMLMTNLKLALVKVWGFITGAGKVIFAVSVILWVLAYFGPSQQKNEVIASDVALEQSYLSKMGGVIEPVIKPLGYDWKIGIGILTSFAARETFVGTIATLYSLEDDIESEEGEGKLLDKMRADRDRDGKIIFSLATGFSILLFYAFAMQCISTIAIVYKETQSLKWTMFQAVGMTAVAYIGAFLVYQLMNLF